MSNQLQFCLVILIATLLFHLFLWSKRTHTTAAIEYAIMGFGGTAGMFNIAEFQTAWHFHYGERLTGEQVRKLLFSVSWVFPVTANSAHYGTIYEFAPARVRQHIIFK